MTQVAEPMTERAAGASGAVVPHWIGGGRVAGTSGRRGPVFNPATGEIAREVDFASVEEVDAAVAAARAAFPAWRATSLSKRTEIMFRIRNLVETHRRDLAAFLTVGARQGALGRPRRDRPRHREPRVRDRHPAPHEGRLLGAGLQRRRRLPDPPAARRRGRHHAVQLPGDGPDVDVRERDRLRQHVHPEAVGEGPLGVDLHGRAPRRGGRARPACSTSSTATRSRSIGSSSTRTSPRCRSSAPRRSRATSTRPARSTASASRRSAARRTT